MSLVDIVAEHGSEMVVVPPGVLECPAFGTNNIVVASHTFV